MASTIDTRYVSDLLSENFGVVSLDAAQSWSPEMYCPKCGTRNDDNAFKCVKCEEVIQPVPVRPQPASIADTPGMRMVLPVGRSALAIIAGYAGLFAVLIFPAPIALILGILAIIDIKRHPEKHGMGRAVFAVVMGGIFTIVLIMFGITSVNR